MSITENRKMEKFIKDKINLLPAEQQEIACFAYDAGYEGGINYSYRLPKSYYGFKLPQNEETSELWNRFWSEGNGELAAAEANHSSLDY
jgi:hypothetical protein